LRVSAREVLRGTFGPKTEKATGGRRKPRSVEGGDL